MYQAQIDKLLEAVSVFGRSEGVRLSKEIESNALLLIRWIEFLNGSKKTQCADELLDGVICAVRETAACLSMGLVRPALFSLRAQIDLVLTWLYFKDHPVEWRNVNQSGEGFKLKTEILKYLMEMYPGFGARFGLLKQTKNRKEEDPYRLLSAHIHAQTTAVVPNVVDLSDAVASAATASECAEIESEVCEYLHDILTCVYLEDHYKFSSEVIDNIMGRLATEKQRLALFDGI